MFTAIYNIQNAGKRFNAVKGVLEKIQKGNKVQIDEHTMFGNINSAFIDLFHSLKILSYVEVKNMSALDMLSNMSNMIYDQYQEKRKDTKRPLTDYIQIFSHMNTLITSFDYSQYKYLCSSDMVKEKFYYWNFGRNTTGLDVLEKVFRLIKHDGPFNMADINCGDGKNLIQLKNDYPDVNIYAVSQKDESVLTKDEHKKLNRFLLGGLKKVKSDNAAFDLVVVTPPITMTRYENEVFLPKEKTYFDRGFSWLRRGGYMIYTLPAFCITESIASSISKNLEDVHIFKDESLQQHDTVAIVGRKKMSLYREVDPAVYAKLRNVYTNQELIEKPENMEFVLPGNMISIKKFRGGSIDDAQMDIFMEDSSAMRDFWKEQKVEKLSENSVHPLLPFTVGQLGLVLTSGCLDGVIEEPNGCSHVVKGRVVKRVDTDREFNDDGTRVQISSTTSNRVEISMFLPDGTFKCLA